MISPWRIKQIFEAISGRRILIAGDVMIDEYLRGNVNRLSPEAPVPIVDIESESFHFGGAANVAFNLKKLGCVPVMVGLIGNDRNGEIFLDLLRDEGITDEGILQLDDRPTTVKTRIIGGNQHLARVDREKIKYLADKQIKQVNDLIYGFLPQVDAIIFEDYNKGLLAKEVIHFTINEAVKRDILSAVDPKFINFMEYQGATVFKPNIKEAAQALALPIVTEDDARNAGFKLLNILNVKCVLLTRGSNGLSLFEDNGVMTEVPTRTRKVADVSGAGDTVISAMTAALCGGSTFQEAAQISNYAAGLVCEEVGIVPVMRDALMKAFD
jgi:rfaE bifunctional protein kinase chain/domain